MSGEWRANSDRESSSRHGSEDGESKEILTAFGMTVK